MKNFKILVLAAMILPCKSHSQELYRISSISYNNVLFSPSLSSAFSGSNFTLLGRKQWSMLGAPVCAALIGHGQLNSSRLFLSGHLITDQIGIYNRTVGSLGLSYKLPLDADNFISAGIAPGFTSDKIDLTRASFNTGDNVINFQIDDRVYVNVNSSITYGNSKIGFTTSVGIQDATRQKNVFGYVSKQFDFGVVDLTASALYKQALTTDRNQIDLNSMVMWKNIVGIGLGYRLNNEIIGSVRFNLKNMYQVGYSYDMGFGKIGGLTGHEIWLRVSLPGKGTSLIRTGYTNPLI